MPESPLGVEPRTAQVAVPGQDLPWRDWERVEHDGEHGLDVMEYVVLVWSHRWLVVATLALVVLASGLWTATRPKLYRSASKLAVQPAPQLSQNTVEAYLNYWEMDRFILDQVQVLQTLQLAQRVVERLGLKSQAELGIDPAQTLLGSLKVKTVEGTDVIEVSFVGSDPERTSEWLNVYVAEYVKANIEDSLERTRQVFEVIQSRLDPLRDQLIQSENELVQFRERRDALLFADQDKNVISEQVNTLTTEYAQAKADRIRLETKINAMQHLRAANLSETSFPEVLQDTTIQGLRQQVNQAQVELSDKLRTFKEGHPVIRELRARITGLESRLQKEIETIETSLRTDFDIASRREQSLYSNLQQLKGESIELSKQTLEYERLRREYDQNKVFLEEMLARSKEADITSSAPMNNIRIIEPARPANRPFTPNLRRSLAVATALGLLLGVGLVIGLQYLDQTIRTPDQVERYLGLEPLAALPKLTGDTGSVLKESFQSLRTALMLAARGEGCQVVMITSSIPAEGKTTVAHSLGKALASSGDRVLVVDADLRKPRLHRLVNASNKRGLTSVVLGEMELDQAIHAVADFPNLDVLASGPIPPNPPDLYGKSTFRALLEQVRQRYAWVIIDTPPVALVTDPVLCARMVDMVLMVVQYGHARRQLVRDALRVLARTDARIVGAVLNKIDTERDHYYYSYYYSRYYHYGYGPHGQPAQPGAAAESGKVG